MPKQTVHAKNAETMAQEADKHFVLGRKLSKEGKIVKSNEELELARIYQEAASREMLLDECSK